MTAIIIFIGLLIGLNFFPQLNRNSFPFAQKIILKALIIVTLLFLVSVIFDINDYKLKGQYTYSLICLLFIINSLLYFAIFKNSQKKILSLIFLIPAVILGVCLMNFGLIKKELSIDSKTKIVVVTGGFLACGEEIKISKSKYVIFNKYINDISKICLTGIEKIDILKIDDKEAKLSIFHDGKNVSENPYKYTIYRNNMW